MTAVDADEARDTWEPARPEDDRQAQRLLRDLARDTAELARLRAAARAERDQLDTWEADVCGTVQRRIDATTEALCAYRAALEALDPDLPKTYRLPGGALTRRAGRPRIEVVDEDAFTTWAELHAPEAVTRRVSVGALKAKNSGYRMIVEHDGDEAVDGFVVDEATGEVVPGVIVPPVHDTYAVKLTEPEPEGGPF